MPKTATAPAAPYFHAKPAREQARARTASIEERTAVLETRWEETVPTLATSRDISDLRGEMRNLENRLIKWGVGAGIALLAVFAAVFIANTARMDALDAKLDSRIDELKSDVRETNARMDRLDARIDRLDAKLDARFDAIMAELREQRGK